MKNCLIPILFCLFLGLSAASAQQYQIAIQRASASIQLDGVLDEEAWQNAETASDFFQNYPFDTSFADVKTEVRITFDDQFLYIGAVCYQPRKDYIITSLKRDFDEVSSDEFAVNIDPFSDKINGFHFAVTPFNVQREGIIDNGSNINADWDNRWFSKVHNADDRWTLEIAIPFKTLRYKSSGSSLEWRINFTRVAIRRNERSSWAPVPRQFDPTNLAYAGTMSWSENPPEPGLNISVIPYITTGTFRDFEFRLPSEGRFQVGGDLKVALTPSLNLDLTVNPDFSQVEVDRQITNLSRFELFFPERRQFFLENEDLFSRFGFPDSRPFFSRRIGLGRGIIRRTTTDGQEISIERAVNVPILAGARLSGKLDKNWRIGLLNMHTGNARDIGLAPANYSVGVLQRKVFDRSYVGAVFVNKENFAADPGGGFSHLSNAYNRVAGLEYNLFSKDNKWEAELYYHRSFSAQNNNDAQSAALFAGRFTREWRLFFPSQYIGSNFRSDAGFVPRTGFYATSPGISRVFFPKKEWLAKRVISYGIGFSTDYVFNTDDNFRMVDQRFSPEAFVEFPGQSSLELSLSSDYTYLFFPFDPTNSGGIPLPEGSDYRYNSFEIEYNSDFRRKFFFNTEFGFGNYFNGNITRLNGALNMRWQPYGVLALSYDYNRIELPAPYNSATFWLVGPRAEMAFSRDLFFSIFLQYNTQSDNVNVNGRLQWRFLPVSDLFVVYTDNYFAEGFFQSPMPKNRGLLLKVTYWLNL